MIRGGGAASDAWYQVVIHAFALGYVLPTLVLVSKRTGILFSGRSVGFGIVGLGIGLALYAAGYPWLLETGGTVPRWLTGAGGVLLAVSPFILAVQAFRGLFTAGRSGY
jgi:hypothetical protein